MPLFLVLYQPTSMYRIPHLSRNRIGLVVGFFGGANKLGNLVILSKDGRLISRAFHGVRFAGFWEGSVKDFCNTGTTLPDN